MAFTVYFINCKLISILTISSINNIVNTFAGAIISQVVAAFSVVLINDFRLCPDITSGARYQRTDRK